MAEVDEHVDKKLRPPPLKKTSQAHAAGGCESPGFARVNASPQALPGSSAESTHQDRLDPRASQRTTLTAAGHGMFFLVLDTARPSVGSPARTWVMPLQARSWQECLLKRFPGLDLQKSLSGTFTLDGKRLSASVPALALQNRVLLLRSYVLLVGMPAPDFAAMRKDALMAEARSFGVQIKKDVTKADGSKHRTWRLTADVAADCFAERDRRDQGPDLPQDASADALQPGLSEFPVDMATLDVHQLRKACHARGIVTKSQQ